MNANEYLLNALKNSRLSIPAKEDADTMWNNLVPCQEKEEEQLQRQWLGVRLPSSGADGLSGIGGAVASMKSMGYIVEEAESLMESGLEALEKKDWRKLRVITSEIHRYLREAKEDPRHKCRKFKRIETWEEYCGAVTEWTPRQPVAEEEYIRKTRAGWYGQMIGGIAGSQLEGYHYNEIATNLSEFKNYFQQPSVYNDDITYEIAFLEAYKKRGRAITSKDIAHEWLSWIPLAMSAEGIAMRNLKQGIYPPESGRQGNYYCEWIGAQMRGAICGMLAPGDSFEAARLAWLDGQISHANNGIIGEVFSALLVSCAYTEQNIREALKKTTGMLPKNSEYYSVIKIAMDICISCKDWRAAWKMCLEELKEYSWVHAYPNAAAEVVAIWFGNNDFEQTLEIICLEGHDADCTAAQLMTAAAIITGTESIDPKWIAPVSGELDTYLYGRKKFTIEELTEETIAAYMKFL
ncbi:MAG: ADP-ribosylglycohydrolase family protein [Lachnospiraceae bacterium]|nr:ADP-ribosylglycohydrolase family protein [Lachnospiraceae bacterium]